MINNFQTQNPSKVDGFLVTWISDQYHVLRINPHNPIMSKRDLETESGADINKKPKKEELAIDSELLDHHSNNSSSNAPNSKEDDEDDDQVATAAIVAAAASIASPDQHKDDGPSAAAAAAAAAVQQLKQQHEQQHQQQQQQQHQQQLQQHQQQQSQLTLQHQQQQQHQHQQQHQQQQHQQQQADFVYKSGAPSVSSPYTITPIPQSIKPVHGTEEWHKQRKENHKEVERRRRESINLGIKELAQLIPTSDTNKAQILQRAVEYIKRLKENESNNMEKWTLEKLLTEQAVSELSNSNEKLKQELERAYREIEQWKRQAKEAEKKLAE